MAIPPDIVGKEHADRIGTRMANLGEIKSRCGPRVPADFATTACAYAHCIECNNLSEKIQSLLDRLDEFSEACRHKLHKSKQTTKIVEKTYC